MPHMICALNVILFYFKTGFQTSREPTKSINLANFHKRIFKADISFIDQNDASFWMVTSNYNIPLNTLNARIQLPKALVGKGVLHGQTLFY